MSDVLVPVADSRQPVKLPATWPWDFLQTRLVLARHLVGDGIDIGPGPHPFPIVNPGTTVRYVDRHEPSENDTLFPELENAGFRAPDIVSDLDVDGLGALADQSIDFAVASHVLEHVANPLRLVDDAHRVLKDGGVLLVLLPDPTRTFDRGRPITPLADIVEEFERGTTAVSDARIVAFLEDTGNTVPTDPDERAGLLELHRRRSVHVHVWDPDAFMEVLLHGVRNLGHRWELVDGVLAAEEGPGGFDFGWVLRRTGRDERPELLAEQLERSWLLWSAHRRAVCTSFGQLQAEAASRAAGVGLSETTRHGFVQERLLTPAGRELGRIARLPALAPARRAYRRAEAALHRSRGPATGS